MRPSSMGAAYARAAAARNALLAQLLVDRVDRLAVLLRRARRGDLARQPVEGGRELILGLVDRVDVVVRRRRVAAERRDDERDDDEQDRGEASHPARVSQP